MRGSLAGGPMQGSEARAGRSRPDAARRALSGKSPQGGERCPAAGRARRIRSVRGCFHQSSVPVTTVCTWPPDQTSPSASTRSSSRASKPTSRPWLAT
jgi:hypothetical protein